jgi:GTP-binding protein Era
MSRYIFLTDMTPKVSTNSTVRTSRNEEVSEKQATTRADTGRAVRVPRAVPAGEELYTVPEELPVQPENPHSLRIAVIGAANAGKSTFLNTLLGTRLSAVSPKAQTTRENMIGVLTRDNVQLVLVDTPGLVPLAEQKKHVRQLVRGAWEAAYDADLLLLLVDVVRRLDPTVQHAVRQVHRLVQPQPQQTGEARQRTAILALNKADLATQEQILAKAAALNQERTFESVYAISALHATNLSALLDELMRRAVPREWEYHNSMRTVQSPVARVVETIKEKLFTRFNQEIPYVIRQKNMGWTELPDGTLAIQQALYVSKESRRVMLLGRGGSAIRFVREAAQRDLSVMFNRPVRLYLTVKVVPDLQNEPDLLG